MNLHRDSACASVDNRQRRDCFDNKFENVKGDRNLMKTETSAKHVLVGTGLNVKTSLSHASSNQAAA
jgi:hypothetical protein